MLSTGSTRKLWLATALAGRWPLVLFDEPAAALDAPSVRCLWQALSDIARAPDGRLVIVASAAISDRVPWTSRIDLPVR